MFTANGNKVTGVNSKKNPFAFEYILLLSLLLLLLLLFIIVHVHYSFLHFRVNMLTSIEFHCS